jgi:hypothetical protein
MTLMVWVRTAGQGRMDRGYPVLGLLPESVAQASAYVVLHFAITKTAQAEACATVFAVRSAVQLPGNPARRGHIKAFAISDWEDRSKMAVSIPSARSNSGI